MRGKPSKSGGPSADRARHARVEAAPARASILDILSIDERTLSTEEMAIELRVETVQVGYHVRVLVLLGLVEIAGEELGPDFHERFYRLVRDARPPSASHE